MMSLSSLSFVHPKNVVGFQNPIGKKSKSNVIMENKDDEEDYKRILLKLARWQPSKTKKPTKPQPEPANWEYKYLYDGACPVCRSLKAGLEGKSTLSLQRGVLCVGLGF